jgi:hypothetical protein
MPRTRSIDEGWALWLGRGAMVGWVEQLDDKTLLVEFSDDQGHAYAVAPCPRADPLALHYVPEAA